MLLNQEMTRILKIGWLGFSGSAALRVRLWKGEALRLKQQRPLLRVGTNWLKTLINYPCYSSQEKAKREGTNICLYRGFTLCRMILKNEKHILRFKFFFL